MRIFLLITISILFALNTNIIIAQNNSQRVNEKALYRPPQRNSYRDTIKTTNYRSSKQEQRNIDSERTNYEYTFDEPIEKTQTDEGLQKYIQDSLAKREAFIRDSILAREVFVRDSILKREAFVRDSLLRRQQILDSITQLKAQLERLIYASLLSQNEDFIVTNGIEIIGDSILGNYNYVALKQFTNQPYKPWLSTIHLSGNSAEFKRDRQEKIITLKTPEVNWMFDYSRDNKILKIIYAPAIAVKHGKNYYKMPYDSVFYGNNGQIIKIKRYADLYQANANYQRGGFLFSNLYQVKQFKYKPYDQNISQFQIVDFCEKWEMQIDNKVCNILNHDVTVQNNTYSIKKTREPVNEFADGTLIYEFDRNKNLSTVTFKNLSNTKTNRTALKLDERGNVIRYIYTVNGVTSNVVSINYFYDNPRAKYKYEVITSTYSEDGISYYEKNITTGKYRERHKMTLEWSEWK